MAIDYEIKEDEMKAVDELRKRFGDDLESELYEDVISLRAFLVARDFDIDKTEKMIKKHLEFRKKYNIKNILSSFKSSEIVEKYGPHAHIGFDKEGNLVIFSPVGNIDISGVLSSCKFEDLIKTAIFKMEFFLEKLRKHNEKHNKIGKVVGIADIANLSFAHVTDKRAIYIFIYLLRICLNNYPDKLKSVYILNASFYFTIVHSLMKSVLPASVMEKIHVYSDDSYKKDLLELMGADELPGFLGGNKTDPDGNPLCLTLGINHTPDRVPQNYYIKRTKRKLSKLPGVKKTTLSRAEFNEIKLDVKELGSYLEWEFETKCRDIGFGLFYEEIIDGEEKITELVPIQRINTEEYPETGTIKCERTGTYVIVFDNTYSWIRGKEIYYRAVIITPKEHEAQLKD